MLTRGHSSLWFDVNRRQHVNIHSTASAELFDGDAERGQQIAGQCLHDSFRLFNQDGGHYSWWDYRQAAFRRNLGLRIDLVLVSEALRNQCRAATIEREPRTWERASDHTPVTLDIDDGG